MFRHLTGTDGKSLKILLSAAHVTSQCVNVSRHAAKLLIGRFKWRDVWCSKLGLVRLLCRRDGAATPLR